MRHIAPLVAVLVLCASLALPAQDTRVYVVGVVDAGPSFPQFAEESAKVLTGANYRVVALPANEAPRGAQDAVDRMFRYRLDALWSVDIRAMEAFKKPTFLDDEKWWRLSVEGVFYRMPGGGDLPRPWTRTLTLEAAAEASDPAQQMNRQAAVQLLAALLQHLGYHGKDEKGPTVHVDYPKEAQSLRTSTVVLLGEVSDDSSVAAVRVNGHEIPFVPQPSVKLYVPIRFASGPLRERLPIVIDALDVYGNVTRREVVMYRGKPLQAKVVSTWGDSITLDRGSLAGLRVGMAFTACTVTGVRDPLTRKKRFDIAEVGVAVITSVRNNGASAKMLPPGATLKRGDLLR